VSVLTYKGYQASVEYESGELLIQLLHIDDFVSTTCGVAAEVETAFRELVDDYLATCAETGRAPNKPYKGSLNIRMTRDQHREVAMAAATAGVSINAWIVGALTEKLYGEIETRPRLIVSTQGAGRSLNISALALAGVGATGDTALQSFTAATNVYLGAGEIQGTIGGEMSHKPFSSVRITETRVQ
jgi:predicted HicB family RNase H-like nuclease